MKVYKGKECFDTTNISVAAAILTASPDVSLVGVQTDENGAKHFLIAPFDIASKLHQQYAMSELMVNANENSIWVRRLINLTTAS